MAMPSRAELLTLDGQGMQVPGRERESSFFSDYPSWRRNAQDDSLFYRELRMVERSGDQQPAEPLVRGLDESLLEFEKQQQAGDAGNQEGSSHQRSRPGSDVRFHDLS